MRKTLAIATVSMLTFAALPASAQRPVRPHHHYPNSVRVWAGVSEPDGDSQYWDDKALDFTGSAEDFDDLAVGVDYLRALSERLSLIASASYWEGQDSPAYLDFVDDFGFPIVHTATLEVSSLTAGLVLHLTRRSAVVAPYVGAGGGLYAWTLTEAGEFIDFVAEPLEIFPAHFQDDGVAFGWYWLAGLDVPVGDSWSLFAQARWTTADDELGSDFEGLGELDLSGRELALGASWRF